MDSDNKELENQNKILHHVVLSRILPPLENELELVQQMIESVENVATWIPDKTVELFQRMKRLNLEPTEDAVSNEIDGLKPGDTFAMIIRRQYAVIMIHLLPDANIQDEQAHNVIVATFQSSVHPKFIYEHDSDLEVIYSIYFFKFQFQFKFR